MGLTRAAAVRSLVGWAVMLGLLVLLAPAQLGGQTGYVIVSGSSMEPLYETGDLLITRPSASYAIGDVVTYRIPDGRVGSGASVVHRIVGGDATAGWVTQGDNSRHLDPWQPTSDDVLGRTVVHVPRAGWLLAWFGQPVIVGAWAAALAVAMYVTGERPPKPAGRFRLRPLV